MKDESVARIALQKAFPGIPDFDMDNLLKSGDLKTYPGGISLCHEGVKEETFYVLLDGEVEVSKVINDTEARILKHLHNGDFFGEMGIIHNAPRAATVTTTKDSTVLEINRAGFEDALNQSSSVSLAMVREVSRRLRENDEMAIEDLRIKAGELAAAYQQLAELDLARREFLTTIAHELRTPLTSASGFMQVIRMGMMEGEALMSALDTVARNIERIVTLTNDILFLQEVDLILSDFEPVDISDVVKEAATAEREYAEEQGCKLILDIPDNLPKTPGDAKSLRRAFSCLINNAVKFSPDGGNVEVSAHKKNESVLVEIVDHGIGIPPYAIGKIFDRFYRIEEFGGRLFGGVGLGLSIAKQVFEQHGGGIKVESEVNRGSRFTVKLGK
jgi:signal transduction histidine kinase